MALLAVLWLQATENFDPWPDFDSLDPLNFDLRYVTQRYGLVWVQLPYMMNLCGGHAQIVGRHSSGSGRPPTGFLSIMAMQAQTVRTGCAMTCIWEDLPAATLVISLSTSNALIYGQQM